MPSAPVPAAQKRREPAKVCAGVKAVLNVCGAKDLLLFVNQRVEYRADHPIGPARGKNRASSNRNRTRRILQTARVPVVEHVDDVHHVRRKNKLVGLGSNAVECVVK